jgi:hypothetical protein
LKNLAKVTGPNQFSLAVGHRTTAKDDDSILCATYSAKVNINTCLPLKVHGSVDIMIYPEPEARDKIHQYPPTHVRTQNTFVLASMNYFDSDMSKSTNTVVYFEWRINFHWP